MAFGGDWFLPPFLRFLVVLGPLMCIEAIVRLVLVASNSEPVGSILGLPFMLFEKPVVAADPAVNPEVRLFDDDGGVLELVSPINRADWDRDGRLPYRGTWYVLDRVDREGRNWSYRFVRLMSVLGGRPMGSVFGWVLRPLYRSFLPSAPE